MGNDVAQQVITVLKFICEQFGLAVDWTIENVEPILEAGLERFVAWKSASYTAWIIVAAVFMIGFIVLAILDHINDWSGGALCAFSIVFASVCLVVMTVHIFLLIKVLTFPELPFYEWITSALRSK